MSEKKKIIIAIDGVSGSGKSVTAREVAKTLGYVYINTGAMYRAVALKCKMLGVELRACSDDALQKLLGETEIILDGDMVLLDGVNVSHRIKAEEIAEIASEVSLRSVVRANLVGRQRLMGAKRGIVAEGRDVGTVVFPDAELKFFMTASSDIRAARRAKEFDFEARKMEQLKASLKQRDTRDILREQSPLVKAHDAILIDTSNMSLEEQVGEILRWVEKAGLGTYFCLPE